MSVASVGSVVDLASLVDIADVAAGAALGRVNEEGADDWYMAERDLAAEAAAEAAAGNGSQPCLGQRIRCVARDTLVVPGTVGTGEALGCACRNVGRALGGVVDVVSGVSGIVFSAGRRGEAGMAEEGVSQVVDGLSDMTVGASLAVVEATAAGFRAAQVGGGLAVVAVGVVAEIAHGCVTRD